mmetsp:Transcript_39397/g.55444  ORF Transcript_39397/g.55444 Transcript_39397/m.55444 type:complete len:82 (+) Transcript_39397:2477-2722(+)
MAVGFFEGLAVLEGTEEGERDGMRVGIRDIDGTCVDGVFDAEVDGIVLWTNDGAMLCVGVPVTGVENGLCKNSVHVLVDSS